MLNLGPIAFAAPWLLLGLAALPVLYWLLKVTPPNPRTISFPAIRLLADLVHREETPNRTPLWILILRILLAALVILALSRPLLNPAATLPGGGPLLLVVDNGWASARDWPARLAAMDSLIDQADRQGRTVTLLATAPSANGDAPVLVGPMPADAAKRQAQTMAPVPWQTDRAGAVKALGNFRPEGTPYVVWLTDGLAAAGPTGISDPATAELATVLRRQGSLEVRGDGAERPALLIRQPVLEGTVLRVPIERSDAGLPLPVTLRAQGADGRLLGAANVTLAAGEGRVEVPLDLPTELRNELASLRLEGQDSAGAVLLTDERWRRRPVGLVSGRASGEQPLLSDLYYLERALAPYAELRKGNIGELLDRNLSVLILADVGSLADVEVARLAGWIDGGGVLLRFAGPRLAQNADNLIPVPLRAGGRALGGALSWDNPAGLSPFADDSPFHGLTVPADVTVKRQVLAEPGIDLASRTWARLVDGTPLVTAERRGRGALVLVHTSAGPDWSNLALSGLYVDMLRRVVSLSAGVEGGEATGTLAPRAILDGYGHLTDPAGTVFPLAASDLSAPVSPRHPPGYYGPAESPRALNLAPSVPAMTTPDALLAGVPKGLYAGGSETELKPTLLTMALILGLIDLLIALSLRGLLPRLAGRGAAAGLALLLAAGFAVGDARADDTRAIEATAQNWLAYVRTGDGAVDTIAKAGLEGLGRVLADRTAVEVAGAMPVDLDNDDLSFFPLIYWPVTEGQTSLSDAARARLNDYMRQGGMVLIDTRTPVASGEGPGGPGLEALLRGLDIPPLAPVGAEHVLTKAFYLLGDFPGRYAGGELWAEAREDNASNDGVSSVIIGSNDWAAAWAMDERGRPLYPVVPGPERQREIAYRVGVNIVMYALTGNYKADQVHVPAILERLGQ
ncbi:DUF4159 domain-containing protein [Niveispirillum sp. KHB5.9]|uniref:DUF4159 domain-containing protein n=1 Tax=Niveispirillum sp. KHB5.9 TaxID=3400269 RepID=UPI003A87B82A